MGENGWEEKSSGVTDQCSLEVRIVHELFAGQLDLQAMRERACLFWNGWQSIRQTQISFARGKK
jgi:hypothetical protein